MAAACFYAATFPDSPVGDVFREPEDYPGVSWQITPRALTEPWRWAATRRSAPSGRCSR